MKNSELYTLLDALFDELFPVLRSITGSGIENSIKVIGRYIPFDYHYVPSGTRVFDWTVPPQWECWAATLTGPDNRIIADLNDSSLCVLNYSEPIDERLSLAELDKHLHSIPDLPDAVPYVTSYYKRNWGFCLPHRVRGALPDGIYHAKIQSTLEDGRVMVADSLLPGESDREIMLSSYMCHPSMANNELSGPLVLLGLYLRLSKWGKRRHSFRFVLNPETIGRLCYLHLKGGHLKKYMNSGLVLACLGGPDRLKYKLSRSENALNDRLAKYWECDNNLTVLPFKPTEGSDERQYCSPGFNLPVGQFTRTKYGAYDEYHNSLDTKEFMGIDRLVESIDKIENFLFQLDNCGYYENLLPYGEPQLGKRGLYPNINSRDTWCSSGDDVFDGRKTLDCIMYLLNYSDKEHDLICIAEKSELSITDLIRVAEVLENNGLLRHTGNKGV